MYMREFYWKDLKGRDPFRGRKCDCNVELDLRGRMCTEFTCLSMRSRGSICEHNEPSGTIKCAEFLVQLNYCQFFKDYVPWLKVKLSLCFNRAPHHEGVLGTGGIAPCILDLGTSWRTVVSFTPLPLYPQGKNPKYPLHRRLGGPQNRSGLGGEEKNSWLLRGLKPPIIQSVAQRFTAEISRLVSLSVYSVCSFNSVTFSLPLCFICL
jgi:hypothetical protein